MILVGYQSDSSNYHIFDLHSGQVSISRDVKFNKKDQDAFPITKDTTTLPLGDIENESDINSKDKDAKRETTRKEDDVKASNSKGYDKFAFVKSQHQLKDRGKLKKPSRYEANLMAYKEPITYKEALSCPDAKLWQKAIDKELSAH